MACNGRNRARVFVFFQLLSLSLLAQCGGSGSSEDPSDIAARVDVKGSVTTQFGSQSQMQSWYVVCLPKDPVSARVAEIDPLGAYTLRGFPTSKANTLVLLSPDLIFSSVLSIPGTVEKTIRQFFRFGGGKLLPQLIHKGPIITFQSTDDLSIEKDTVTTTGFDGIPDGMKSLSLTNHAFQGFNATTQGTAPANNSGIINYFNDDDDGDAIADVFDQDSNGDLTADATNEKSDLYFDEGVRFISVQLQATPQDDGTTKNVLLFSTKLRDGISPSAVQIRGPASLINDSTVEIQDTKGNTATQAWDKLLLDDALSGDGAADDKVFARRVNLGKGKGPRAQQTIFFQLAFGTPETPVYWEYPYKFPNITLGTISVDFDKITRTALIGGQPFGSFEDFLWSVSVFNSDNKWVFTSRTVPGKTKTFEIQESVFEKGKKYRLQVAAQSPDRMGGVPAYIVYSLKTSEYEM